MVSLSALLQQCNMWISSCCLSGFRTNQLAGVSGHSSLVDAGTHSQSLMLIRAPVPKASITSVRC